MASEDFKTAMTNRSLRTVKAELEFLSDASILTPQQLQNILDQLPGSASANAAATTAPSTRSPLPTARFANLGLNNDRNTNTFTPSPQPQQQQQQQQPPPAYPVAPAPPASTTLTYATALYAYQPQDAGDLGLVPQERVAVTEYMNAEWWKGRSEKTGNEGIFPRSYVRVDGSQPPRAASNYGNMPLDVSQGGGDPSGAGHSDSRYAQEGKKFGKKLGNAAIFGAGATIGSDIVNTIF